MLEAQIILFSPFFPVTFLLRKIHHFSIHVSSHSWICAGIINSPPTRSKDSAQQTKNCQKRHLAKTYIKIYVTLRPSDHGVPRCFWGFIQGEQVCSKNTACSFLILLHGRLESSLYLASPAYYKLESVTLSLSAHTKITLVIPAGAAINYYPIVLQRVIKIQERVNALVWAI